MRFINRDAVHWISTVLSTAVLCKGQKTFISHGCLKNTEAHTTICLLSCRLNWWREKWAAGQRLFLMRKATTESVSLKEMEMLIVSSVEMLTRFTLKTFFPDIWNVFFVTTAISVETLVPTTTPTALSLIQLANIETSLNSRVTVLQPLVWRPNLAGLPCPQCPRYNCFFQLMSRTVFSLLRHYTVTAPKLENTPTLTHTCYSSKSVLGLIHLILMTTFWGRCITIPICRGRNWGTPLTIRVLFSILCYFHTTELSGSISRDIEEKNLMMWQSYL